MKAKSNSALIAIDPISEKGKSFERFCEIVHLLQKGRVIGDSTLVSVLHASLYAMPAAWYRESKSKIAKEAMQTLHEICRNRIEFVDAKVLHAESADNESLVEHVSRFGRREDRELLVVASNDRSGLPQWILGSFSETAALTSKLSVLVIKPHLKTTDFSTKPRLVVAVDVEAPPTPKELRWIARLCLASGAKLDMVYAMPRRFAGPFHEDDIRQPNPTPALKALRLALKKEGVSASVAALDTENGKRPLEKTISDFADARKAWGIITISAKRSRARALFLGSTTRRLLARTKRPFLSLRLE